MLKFVHLVINHLQLNTQRVWHTGEVNNTTSTLCTVHIVFLPYHAVIK